MKEGTSLMCIAISREMKEKLTKIMWAKDAKNIDIYAYIRKVLSNHIVDRESQGVIE